MEMLLIYLVLCSGFIGAVICMVFATQATGNLLRILILTGIAILLLFAQRSCWNVLDDLSGIGHTTKPTIFGTLPTIALIICGLWTVILVISWFHERKTPPEDDHHDEWHGPSRKE